jgi:hypothetical protein
LPDISIDHALGRASHVSIKVTFQIHFLSSYPALCSLVRGIRFLLAEPAQEKAWMAAVKPEQARP